MSREAALATLRMASGTSCRSYELKPEATRSGREDRMTATLHELHVLRPERECCEAATSRKQAAERLSRDVGMEFEKDGRGEIVVQSMQAGTACGSPQLYTPAQLFAQFDLIVI